MAFNPLGVKTTSFSIKDNKRIECVIEEGIQFITDGCG